MDKVESNIRLRYVVNGVVLTCVYNADRDFLWEGKLIKRVWTDPSSDSKAKDYVEYKKQAGNTTYESVSWFKFRFGGNILNHPDLHCIIESRVTDGPYSGDYVAVTHRDFVELDLFDRMQLF